MITPTRLTVITFLLACAFVSASASAHGVRFGIGIGFPVFPWYYPAPYYYHPPPAPVVMAPSAPPAYVERRSEAAAAPAEHFWYYCNDSQAFYPYVRQCASPWERVTPTPPLESR